MRIFKRLTALILVAIMIVAMMPTSSKAANEDSSYEAGQEVSYHATNALGNVLATAIEESDANKTDDSYGYYILDVVVTGTYAEVNLSSPDEATLVVAIYDEEGTTMLTSGKTEVSASDTTIQVELDDYTRPESFIVKAFLLDGENVPLCKNYESRKYTEAFQEFLAKDTTDFEEGKVINLDDDTQTNFAVVSDDAQIIEQSTEKNILVTNDYENGIYVFENADEEITSLQSGDVFYYVYGEGVDDYILTKVGTVNNDNGTVTITTADEFEISDLFSYIKIDTTTGENVVAPYALSRSYDENAGNVDDYSAEFKTTFSKEYEENALSVKFAGELSVKFYLQFYYDFNLFSEDYYELTNTVTVSVSGETTIKASVEKECTPLIIFHGGIPIIAGLEAETEVSLVFKFSAEVSASGKIEVKMVYGLRKIAGQSDEDLSKKPTVTLKFDAEGKVAFDIIPSVSVGFNILHVTKVNIGVEADLCISGTIELLEVSSDESLAYPDKKHLCSKCIDGDVKLSLTGSIKATFGINKKKQKTILKIDIISLEKKLMDFYMSMEMDDEGMVSSIDFGKGTCPNMQYKVTFQVTDAEENPIEGAMITDTSNQECLCVTDEDGSGIAYFFCGTQNVSVQCDGYNDESSIFAIVDKARSVTVELECAGNNENENPENPDGTQEGPGGAVEDNDGTTDGTIAFGSCGENVSYVLYEDGTLVISGTGAMKDYTTQSARPWYSYRKNIAKVIIENGVTHVGTYAFSYFTQLEDLVIPYGVVSIGAGALYGCINLIDVIIPESVTSIGGWALANCSNLTDVTIPFGITKIAQQAFEGCASIVNVVIPSEVYQIGWNAFNRCTSLRSIQIPERVSNIYDKAFQGCSGLTDVYYEGTEEQWQKIVVGETNENLLNATIHFNSTMPTDEAEPLMLTRSYNAFRSVSAVNNVITKNITGTTAGNYYVILVVKDKEASDLLCADNLLYIDQKLAESQTLSFKYKIDSDITNYDVIIAPNVKQQTENKPNTNVSNGNTVSKKTIVKLVKNKATIYLKGALQIESTVLNGVGKTTYKSSNTKVAKVDANGKVIAKKAGKAIITVTNNGASQKFTVTVKRPKLNKSKITLKKGKSVKLKVKGKIGKAKFKSSNKKIATVNSKGKIVAKKKGSAVIKVKTNGITLKCKVKVK